MSSSRNDNSSTISSGPHILPKKAYVPPPSVPENKAIYRFLSGRHSTATTVFVGNISEKSNDNLIRHVLQAVGRVINWRRVQGANAKLESFGFVEYADQEDALRALRLVNDLKTKVDEKTRINLDRYEQEQRDYPGDPNETDQISHARKVDDDRILREIDDLLKGHIVFNRHSHRSPRRNKPGSRSSPDKWQDVPLEMPCPIITEYGLPRFSFKEDGPKSQPLPKSRDRRRRSLSSEEEAREQEYEERRLERRRQYKEDCYQNRVRRWQNYEKNLQVELEKRKSRESRRLADRDEKIKRTLDFLENYDDDIHDNKFYRGTTWQTKLLEREAELEADEKDRKRDISNAAEKEITPVSSSELESDPSEPEAVVSEITISPPIEPQPLSTGTNMADGVEENLVSYYRPDSSKPIGFGIKRPSQPTPCTAPAGLEEVFMPDEVVEPQPLPKKVKLTYIDEKTKMSAPVEFGPESAKYLTPEERGKKIKRLVSKIPVDKDKLFSYDVKWFLVDQQFVERRITPWVRKRIFDYLGEEEATLVKYISTKIIEKSSPDVILKDISIILDEEAQIFVVKLWRFLIFETEAKSQGLVVD